MEEQTHYQDDPITTKGPKIMKVSRYCQTKYSFAPPSPRKNRRKTTNKLSRGLIPTSSKRSTTSGTIKVNESSREEWKKDAPSSKQSTTSLFMVTQGLAKRCK